MLLSSPLSIAFSLLAMLPLPASTPASTSQIQQARHDAVLSQTCRHALRTYYRKRIRATHGDRGYAYIVRPTKHRHFALTSKGGQTKRLKMPSRIGRGLGVVMGYSKGGECGYVGDDFFVYFQAHAHTATEALKWRKRTIKRASGDGIRRRDLVPRTRGVVPLQHTPENWQTYHQWRIANRGVEAVMLDPGSRSVSSRRRLKAVVSACLGTVVSKPPLAR